MEISGIGSAADFCRYVSQRANSSGGTFADFLSLAVEEENAESSVGSELEVLGKTLMDVYRNALNKGSSEDSKEEKKDYWELRTERQKKLDEYFEKKELQRRAFEKKTLNKKMAMEYFFSGDGVLFLHSAAAEVMGLL